MIYGQANDLMLKLILGNIFALTRYASVLAILFEQHPGFSLNFYL